MNQQAPHGSAGGRTPDPGPARSTAAATATSAATTPAQRRVVADVLGWGASRPRVPIGLVAGLRERLEDGLRAIGPALPRVALARRDGRIVVSRTLLQRSVCQGWQLAPEPFVHTTASVRGVLGRTAILTDLGDRQQHDPAAVAAGCWERTASDRPGDPRSISAWLNQVDATARSRLQAEVADLLATVREVWPVLPADRVELALDVPRRIGLADGAVELVTTVDLAVGSRVDDGRARQLVVDLRTGQPRAPLDLLALRFVALCSALAAGEPPFRWSTFYVTEGRFASEDLPGDLSGDVASTRVSDPAAERSEGAVHDPAFDPAVHPLGRVVDRIIGAVADLVALDEVAGDAPESTLRLDAGVWCSSCRRRPDCSVAASARPAGSAWTPG